MFAILSFHFTKNIQIQDQKPEFRFAFRHLLFVLRSMPFVFIKILWIGVLFLKRRSFSGFYSMTVLQMYECVLCILFILTLLTSLIPFQSHQNSSLSNKFPLAFLSFVLGAHYNRLSLVKGTTGTVSSWVQWAWLVQKTTLDSTTPILWLEYSSCILVFSKCWEGWSRCLI